MLAALSGAGAGGWIGSGGAAASREQGQSQNHEQQQYTGSLAHSCPQSSPKTRAYRIADPACEITDCITGVSWTTSSAL